ncbi:bifunctional glycosyltransferase/CDP-glycerol:glycerophosphate glycerophosphotransferase [Leucobacter luti]|uniref:Glycosyltransferase involved in cell wall biosynthesis n=1 Tax=Leucobacter luti TaxID=340320 RepID=A0A4Q7TQB1_9MICO|nr:glycosyltransferase [Leucobacter luti]RZT62936.1 glycosyltransferase involved in cell wall biosynthesis [Leucobacter luti]
MGEFTATNRSEEAWAGTVPHTSLIIACYRVGPYLPGFFASLDAQRGDHSGVELIFVIDGCPEDSEEVVRAWMPTTDYAVRILVKPNGGVASARNLGLEWARGTWVSHPDPDDQLDPEYLAEVEAAKTRYPAATMFAARAVLTDPDGSEIGHTLDARYVGSDTRLIDLAVAPRLIHTLGGVAFFRRDIITAHGLRFNEEILQSSDTDFIGHFLLCNGAQYVLVPGARYQYMRRSDGSSIVSTHSGNMSRYASLFGISHRGLLDRAGDECPPWLANLLLYFVFMLFRRNRNQHTPVDLEGAAELARIRKRLRENLRSIGARNITQFDLFDTPSEFRAAWLSALDHVESSAVEHLSWSPADGTRRVGILTTRRSLRAPVYGVARSTRVLGSKRRAVEFLGATWLYQHVFKITVQDGRLPRLAMNDPKFTLRFDGAVLGGGEIRKRSGLLPPIVVQPRSAPTPAPTPAPAPVAVPEERTGLIAKLRRRRSQPTPEVVPAWVFIATETDRTFSGEVLARFVAQHRPEIQTYFVTTPGSATELRLTEAGFSIVAERSPAHLAVMHRAKFVFVPSVTRAARVPFPGSDLQRRWHIVLLPDAPVGRLGYRDRGFAQAELVPVASTVEVARLGGQYSHFPYLPEDVLLTGLPHHDALEAARAHPAGITVAPHWRAKLPTQLTADQLDSLDFVTAWREFLASPRLRELADHSGGPVRLALPAGVPAGYFTPPEWVVPVAAGADTVRALGSSAVLVTDYSPRSRDMAYLERPTVYLQPDRTEVFGKPDSAKSRDSDDFAEGFGPVTASPDAALSHVSELLADIPSQYQERMTRAFMYRDGDACARLVAALLKSDTA